MKKLLSLILALAVVFSMSLPAFASDSSDKTMTIPVTVSIVHTAKSIDVSVPAAFPVSVVDGVVRTADNLFIRNNSTSTAVLISNVSVTNASYTVASYSNFPSGRQGMIALSINGCETVTAGDLRINSTAFPTISPSSSLPVRYNAKVSDFGSVSGVTAANIVFTLKTG